MSKPIRYESDYDGERYPIYCEDETRKIGPVAIRTIPTNPNCRYFVSRLTLGEGYCNWKRQSGFADYGTKWGIIELLSEVPGVDDIHANSAYSLMISKPESWEWEEIEPAIVRILSEFNGVEVKTEAQ